MELSKYITLQEDFFPPITEKSIPSENQILPLQSSWKAEQLNQGFKCCIEVHIPVDDCNFKFEN